jgi:SAM-dependent methyltransferase
VRADVDVIPTSVSRTLTFERAEDAYRLLASYRFAQRLVKEKLVADIRWEEVGPGTRLLADTADSVVGLTSSPEASKTAQALHPAPNLQYGTVEFPKLPYPADHFDTVVALEVLEKLERPGDLMAEVKRVLKDDGVLVVSTLDRQVRYNDRNMRDPGNRGRMYVSEFEEMLRGLFSEVETYRVGAVAGGLVHKPGDSLSSVETEGTRFVLTEPPFGGEPPVADVALAVCGDAELPSVKKPYLLVDQDRRLLDECEDSREDVQLLREEILHMQQTEVQVFRDALELRDSHLAYLRAQHRELQDRHRELEDRLRLLENSRGWRALELLRRLRAEGLQRLGKR